MTPPRALIEGRSSTQRVSIGVEARAAREEEVAAVDAAEVDRARDRLVGELQEMLGRIDQVGRDSEHPAGDVRAPAGQERERDLGAREAVRDLVGRAVAAKGDHEVAPLFDRLARERGGVVAALGLDGVARRSVRAARRRRGS